jgi:hypothetical protein
VVGSPVVGSTVVESPVVGNHRLLLGNPQGGFKMGSRRILSDGEDTDNETMDWRTAGNGTTEGRLTGGGIAGGWKPPATNRKPAKRVSDSEEL